MANIAYVRVSTVEQNEDRQKEALGRHQIDKWFEEKVSGKNIDDRKQLQAMLEYVREGDTVYVKDFSRLARSTKDLLAIVDLLKENLDSSTSTGKLMLTMISAINEFERQNILERQAEGIALAKKQGVYKGRKKIIVKDFEKYYDKYMHRELKKQQWQRS